MKFSTIHLSLFIVSFRLSLILLSLFTFPPLPFYLFTFLPFYLFTFLPFSDSQLLADILGNGILVDEEVHGVVGNESFGHVPCAFVVAVLTP